MLDLALQTVIAEITSDGHLSSVRDWLDDVKH